MTLQTACDLGYAYIGARRGVDAVRILQPAIEARAAAWPADSSGSIEDLNLLRIAYDSAGRRDDADALAERILAICVDALAPITKKRSGGGSI